MSLKTIKLYKSPSEVPIIEFHLSDGERGLAIVDTGSESTVIDASFSAKHPDAVKLKKTTTKINLIGIQGSQETDTIKANVDLLVNAECMKDKATLPIRKANIMNLDYISKFLQNEWGTDDTIDVIIGSDVLQKLKARIDYREQILILDL